MDTGVLIRNVLFLLTSHCLYNIGPIQNKTKTNIMWGNNPITWLLDFLDELRKKEKYEQEQVADIMSTKHLKLLIRDNDFEGLIWPMMYVWIIPSIRMNIAKTIGLHIYGRLFPFLFYTRIPYSSLFSKH